MGVGGGGNLYTDNTHGQTIRNADSLSPTRASDSDNTWCSLIPSVPDSSLVRPSSLAPTDVPLAITDLKQTSRWDAELVHPVYVTGPSIVHLALPDGAEERLYGP